MGPARDRVRQKLEAIKRKDALGKIPEARRELLRLCQRKLPRELLADAANLARVIDLPQKGVQLLHRYVRPPKGALKTATIVEQAVYAACLTEIGAVEEARELLESLDASKFPRVHFYRALNRLFTWDWAGAIPHLQPASRSELPVNRVVGKLWLALALMHGRADYQRSLILLGEALRESEELGDVFLRKRALAFLIMNYFHRREWKQASRRLDDLEKINSVEKDFYYELLVRQWRCMVALFNPRGDGGAGTGELEAVRDAFAENGKWEDARGCDYYLALYCRDQERLAHLYFGSPHPSFRDMVARALGGSAKVPGTYLWKLREKGSATAVTLDVHSGQTGKGKVVVKPGQVPHRLLAALCTDFYRPLLVAQLHEALYPGEYFNVESGPDRVHQACMRLRELLKAAKVPLALDESGGYYRLRATGAVSLLLRADQATAPKTSAKLARLKAAFGGTRFSAGDAAKALGVSYRSAVASLNELGELGLAERIGAGRSTRYRVL